VARRVFYSFHYKPDNWRASQIRNMGVVDGNRPCSDNDWETITRGGDDRIRRWIADQMDGKSCTVVLIGTNTAGRKWINYEIIKTWDDHKGVVGVHVHNLQDSDQRQSVKGANPFAHIGYGNTGRMLSSIVRAYDPPYVASRDVYKYINDHLDGWVEEAVTIRNYS
jgi:Thoeris protein ThsB, TIR-like domain